MIKKTKHFVSLFLAVAMGLTCYAQTPADSTNVEETDTTIQNDDLQGGITRGK